MGERRMNAALPFTVHGVTVRGKRLGTELGFPTANLDYPPDTALPPNGVYVARAEIGGRSYTAILNQGRHPTVPEGRSTIETHLLSYEGGDLYGRELTLTYLHFLRPERRFGDLAALRAQLRADEKEADRWMRTDDETKPPAR
jgi:riboflavin kinase/FMN adenylyltransferase